MDKPHWNSSLAMKDTISMLDEEAIIEASDMIRDALWYIYWNQGLFFSC